MGRGSAEAQRLNREVALERLVTARGVELTKREKEIDRAGSEKEIDRAGSEKEIDRAGSEKEIDRAGSEKEIDQVGSVTVVVGKSNDLVTFQTSEVKR